VIDFQMKGMKIRTSFWLFLIVGFAFVYPTEQMNTNTYHVHLGKKTVFTSSKNSLGSTVSLITKNILPNENFKVSGFICGGIGQEFVVHLKLTNEHDAILIDTKQSIKGNSHDATVQWKDITSSANFKDSKAMQVYYCVSETKNRPAHMTLICRVDLK